MTNRDCTATTADPGNIIYPSFLPVSGFRAVAEDHDEYHAPDGPGKLSCGALNAYIKQRLQDSRQVPARLYYLLDELGIMLRQCEEIDVFDLLVELVLIADREPARLLSALMAVLDDNAANNLEPNTIADTGAFIHDALKQDAVRWALRDYHEEEDKNHD